MMRIRILLVLFACSLFFTAAARAREPGWTGPVIAFGAERERIQSTPVLMRANRPFHFYGNTVRRIHYRGTALPNWRDLRNTTAVLVRGR